HFPRFPVGAPAGGPFGFAGSRERFGRVSTGDLGELSGCGRGECVTGDRQTIVIAADCPVFNHPRDTLNSTLWSHESGRKSPRDEQDKVLALILSVPIRVYLWFLHSGDAGKEKTSGGMAPIHLRKFATARKPLSLLVRSIIERLDKRFRDYTHA